jgi:hypothetical protein
LTLADFGLPLALGGDTGSTFISGSDLASLDLLLSILTLFERPLDADAGSDFGSALVSDLGSVCVS